MDNNQIIVLYKEVGKVPILTKVENSIEYFEKELEGEIEIIPYENIFIICKKDRERLRPNIFVNKSFGKFDSNIRGNVFLIAQKDNKFISLTKGQALQYFNFLQIESFNYKHFDENGKYLSTYQLRQRNKKQRELEKQQKQHEQQECKQGNDFITIVPVSDSLNSKNENKNCLNNLSVTTTNNTSFENASSNVITNTTADENNTPDTTEQTLALILQIQNAILEFIKRYAENNDTED